MTRTEIDFLDEQNKIVHAPRKKRKFISKLLTYLLVIFVILGVSSGVGVISSTENLAKTLGQVGLWDQIKHFFGGEEKKLQGEEADRINILLLGIGGDTHDGPYLSDTNIIVSFKPSTKQVALISVPRDLLAPIPGYGWLKINHADAYGEVANPGRGGELAQKVFSEVFGIPIQYYVRVDFSGFKQIIDDLGGITIEVENKLDDYEYPVKGKETATTTERYEHLHIDAGQQWMDGDLALKYVRSRHALGAEGSDFARSKRQQKVLMAVKEKGLAFTTLINPYKISRVMDTLSQHLATNLEAWEIIRFFNLGRDVGESDIVRQVFDDSAQGYLVPAITEGGAFVLKPRSGDYAQLREIVNNIFSAGAVAGAATANPTTTENKAAAELPAQKPAAAAVTALNLEIKNGTNITGLASKISERFAAPRYQVIKIGNAPTRDYQKTVVYDLRLEAADEAAAQIAKLLGAEVASAIPAWVKATTTPAVSAKTDILIILGHDQNN